MPKKFIKSLLNASRGIVHGIASERNLRIQVAIGFIAILASLFLKIPRIDFIIVLTLSFLVVSLELLNTCFERLIDFLSPYYHEEFGNLKDMMAGVVLLSAVLSAIAGILIFYKPVISMFKEPYKLISLSDILIVLDVILFAAVVILASYAFKKAIKH